jgi:hypothetical protein
MHGIYSVKKAFGFRTRPNQGASFPLTPLYGESFYRTDLKQQFVFIGVGEPGTLTTAGWFNLKHAQYAA